MTNIVYCHKVGRGSYLKGWHWNLFPLFMFLFVFQQLISICVLVCCLRHAHANHRSSALTTVVFKILSCFAALFYFPSNNPTTGTLVQVQLKVLVRLSIWLINWLLGLLREACSWLHNQFTDIDFSWPTLLY